MTCSDESQSVIVAIFHKITPNCEIIPELINSLKQEFVNQYADTHSSLRKEIDSVVAEKGPFLVYFQIYFHCIY